jgi:hypothetical protein
MRRHAAVPDNAQLAAQVPQPLSQEPAPIAVRFRYRTSQRESIHGGAEIGSAQKHGAKIHIVDTQAQASIEQDGLKQDRRDHDARRQDGRPQVAGAQALGQDIGNSDPGPKPPERQISAALVAPGDRAQRRA